MRLTALVYLLVVITAIDCYKFLFLFPTPSRSHVIQGRELGIELARRGHQVDFVSPFPLNEPVGNYTDVVLDGFIEKIREGGFQFKLGQTIGFSFFLKVISKQLMTDDYQMGFMMLNHTKFQTLLQDPTKHYDAIVVEIVFCDALTQLSHKYQAPLIGFFPGAGSAFTDQFIGNPTFTAITPSLFLPMTDKMNFRERMLNTVFTTLFNVVFGAIGALSQSRIRNKFFPSDYPPLEATRTNFSIILTNSDPVISFPRPLVPGYIDITGFHVKPPKQLPGDLKDILDAAKKGVIYFSMGTNLETKDLSPEKLKVFFDAFSQFDQTILWKWEDEKMENQPKNVVIRKWFSQTDVLAHDNVKLFITHGGIGSIMEAFVRGVPMLLLPIFGDQTANAVRAELVGYGKQLNFDDITTEMLVDAIREVLINETYAIKIKERQRMLLEKPIKPLDNAMFWMEYVAKYGGAPQFRSRILDLNFFQLYLLDVTGFLIGCLIVALIIGYYCLKLTKKVLCKVIGMVKSKRKENKKGHKNE